MFLPRNEAAVAAGALPASVTRRRLMGTAGAGLALTLLGACGRQATWHSTDISGSFPDLAFTMTRASDGKSVTAADYRGQVVMLYFGYTFCPDICPTTLANVADMLSGLGDTDRHVHFLFVTVDPNRDSASLLADYVKNFGPEVEGLRGTPDQLAALARRYRVVYSVTPASAGRPYEVTHSSAIYVFDASGAARLVATSLSSANPDKAGVGADLKRLVGQAANPPGLLDRLLQLV
jgi:protein SCO1/2